MKLVDTRIHWASMVCVVLFLPWIISDETIEEPTDELINLSKKSCLAENVLCTKESTCCQPLVCLMFTDTTPRCSQRSCLLIGSLCNRGGECCPPSTCFRQNDSSSVCTRHFRMSEPCGQNNSLCSEKAPCCLKLQCNNSTCKALKLNPIQDKCRKKGENCSSEFPCCSDLFCNNFCFSGSQKQVHASTTLLQCSLLAVYLLTQTFINSQSLTRIPQVHRQFITCQLIR